MNNRHQNHSAGLNFILPRAALLATAILWGTSLTFAKFAIDDVPTNTLLAWRFTIAAPITALIFYKKLKNLKLTDILIGFLGGTLLYTSYALQTFSINFTTPGRAAFLNATYCVFVPFLAYLIMRSKLDRFNIAASVCTFVGAGLIGMTGNAVTAIQGTSAVSVLTGDGIALISGILFALYIIMVGKYARKTDPILLTIVQFFTAAVEAWICSRALRETISAALDYKVISSVVYLAVVCTILALLLQNIGQKYTEPATAAILLSTESIFGLIFPACFGMEAITPLVIFGFALIFLATIISETKLKFLCRRQKRKDLE
ncbi:DMT family transporter [Amygdalobacter indicium]|uniref:DMT family transporter n=1 Tax=Amygdalobacter indicium TaxID=3029272 RepID=A0ABY8C6T6_9FIRM|nr:DMT family transporter [Amygdalobacter indicium]WEG35043.1 DMT family transporter [Amygdalobacter indicium]